MRRDLPPPAIAFLADQRLIVASAVAGPADDERVWTTVLTGAPGFLDATADRLTIGAAPPPDDPLAGVLAGPALVGLLAIEPATRRRLRVNGRSRPTVAGLVVEPDEVVSNCPKYIVRRSPATATPAATTGPPAVHGRVLTDEQARWIAAADTFFLGTADRDGNADASHRGGDPGFVEVLAADRLRFADQPGNRMYLTLGNLAERPAAGLLVVDWTTGATLQLTGRARVELDAPPDRSPTGRELEVVIDEVVAAVRPELAGWTALDAAS